MTSNLVELRPNRRFLDHEFEGYKLNLNALPQHRLNLQSYVDRLYPDDIQYSFIHAKMFALHNHLIPDYWDHSFNFYFIDKNQQVRNITFENMNNTFQQSVVYDVPASDERKSGNFNLCVQFPSSNLAVISDGRGYLYIVDTGIRNKPASEKSLWKTLYSTLALEGKYFILVDTRVQDTDSKEVIHCLLQSVEQNEKHFNSVLTWITLENDGQGWKQVASRQLQGKGIVHYAAFEVGCSAIYVASDNLFKFISDSERDILEPTKETHTQIIYTWLQTADDVTITLQLENKFDKNLLHVNVTPLTVKVSYAGKEFVNGKLNHKVDSELTTWNIQDDGQVNILITKSESMLWDELIEDGDCNGEQIIDASLVEATHQRLAHLCSESVSVMTDQSVIGLSTQELEECDAASEEDTILVRIDATNHQITHRVALSVHQYLFTQHQEIQQAPAICLRHDVDACIWQPFPQIINSETWPIKHHGTLMAFGYVQSSKQNRKFITCPPNFSYGVVSEATRHIFIYKNSAIADCQLRKRSEGAMKNIKIGQQNVINVEKNGEVLGINATNEYLFILTESVLLAIEVR